MRKAQKEDDESSSASAPAHPPLSIRGVMEVIQRVVRAEVAVPLAAMQHVVRSEMERIATLNEAVLTRTEVAERLRVSEKSVSKYVRESRMPAVRIGPEYRFIWSDVLKWLRSRPSNKQN